MHDLPPLIAFVPGRSYILLLYRGFVAKKRQGVYFSRPLIASKCMDTAVPITAMITRTNNLSIKNMDSTRVVHRKISAVTLVFLLMPVFSL